MVKPVAPVHSSRKIAQKFGGVSCAVDGGAGSVVVQAGTPLPPVPPPPVVPPPPAVPPAPVVPPRPP